MVFMVVVVSDVSVVFSTCRNTTVSPNTDRQLLILYYVVHCSL